MTTVLLVCDQNGFTHRFQDCGIRQLTDSMYEVFRGPDIMAWFTSIAWWKYVFEEDQSSLIESLSSPLVESSAKPLWLVTLPIVAVIGLGIALGLYKIYGG